MAESGLRGRVTQLGESIADLVDKANSIYSAKEGVDLFKPTAKSLQALRRLGRVAKDFAAYQSLVDDLYFIFREGPGSRLDGFSGLTSFSDINDLRTELRHDVDHGKTSKVSAKRRKLGATFHRYSGSFTPVALAPERFAPVQAKILSSLELDLYGLISQLTQRAGSPRRAPLA